ncbi:hypothetical protein C0Q70_15885, partial [Pomacea canaliculata]
MFSAGRGDELADTITSYLQFCEDSAITTKETKVYANSKPWINRELRQCLREKKEAFAVGDMNTVREKTKLFRTNSVKARAEYKDKVEAKFRIVKAKEAWQGLNNMMGRTTKSQYIKSDNPKELSEELNRFYARFDVGDSSSECENICSKLTTDAAPLEVGEQEVERCLRRLKPNKAPGPDGLRGSVLKTCSQQLAPMLTQLFSLFLNIPFVPRMQAVVQKTVAGLRTMSLAK